MFKKAIQQGRRGFGARSVHGVREHTKSPRTQLAVFFNIPRKGSEDLATSSTPTVDQSNLGQAPRLRQELTRTFVIQLLFLGLNVGCRPRIKLKGEQFPPCKIQGHFILFISKGFHEVFCALFFRAGPCGWLNGACPRAVYTPARYWCSLSGVRD